MPVPIPEFVEREPWERGFAAVFARDVAPDLARLERRRRLVFAAMIVLAVVGAGVCLLALLRLRPGAEAQATVVGTIGGSLLLGSMSLAAWFERFDERLVLGAICRHFGGLQVDVAAPRLAFGLEPYWQLRLLPRAQATVREAISGAYRGFDLAVAAIKVGQHLTEFSGVAIAISMPAAGRGYAGCRFSVFDPGSLTPARQPQTAAVDVRTAEFAQALARLQRVLEATNLAGGVAGTMLFLSAERARRRRPFATGRAWRSVYHAEGAIRTVLAELAAVRRLIDVLAEVCPPPGCEFAVAAQFAVDQETS